MTVVVVKKDGKEIIFHKCWVDESDSTAITVYREMGTRKNVGRFLWSTISGWYYR